MPASVAAQATGKSQSASAPMFATPSPAALAAQARAATSDPISVVQEIDRLLSTKGFGAASATPLERVHDLAWEFGDPGQLTETVCAHAWLRDLQRAS